MMSLLMACQAMAQTGTTWLRATVLHDRKFLLDVPRESFTIIEGGKVQTIETFEEVREPVSIGIVLDNSGSLKEHRELTRRQFSEFLKGMRDGDEFFLSSFSDVFRIEQDFTGDANLLQAAFDRRVLHGPTALLNAIWNSAQHLASTGTRQNKILVVFSDRQDNSSKAAPKAVLQELMRLGIILYEISPVMTSEFRDESGLAEATGGSTYVYNPAYAKTMPTEIAAMTEIMHRFYRLSFRSSAAVRPGKQRKISVKVSTPKARVLTRVTSGASGRRQ